MKKVILLVVMALGLASCSSVETGSTVATPSEPQRIVEVGTFKTSVFTYYSIVKDTKTGKEYLTVREANGIAITKMD